MNQRLLLVPALLLAIGLTSGHARTLSPEEALSRAFEQNQTHKIKGLNAFQASNLIQTIPTSSGDPAIYLFGNNADSYVAVSANDIASPILAYGSAPAYGSNTEMPPQMKWMLEEYAREIAFADSVAAVRASKGVVPGNTVMRKADCDVSHPDVIIKPLLSTVWNQDTPFNDYCPEEYGYKSYTGCVATAIAQVMNYHKYPEASHGTGHATVAGTDLTRDLNVTFDWGNMIDNYNNGYSATEADAVANLMVTCGFAVDMMYSTQGSGAYDINVPKAFTQHFDYDLSAWLYYRNYYTLTEWEHMLVNELTENGPIYYSGQSPEGGHAFVCDGYEGDGLFHFNWGWGGAYDGFFRIDALNPEGEGIGGFEGGYNSGQTAMMGVRKPAGGSELPESRLTMQDVAPQAMITDGYLMIEGFWYNSAYADAQIYVGLEFENIETGETSIRQMEDELYELPSYYGLQWAYSEERTDLPDGTYRVKVVSLDPRFDEWKTALHNLDIRDYILVNISEGTATVVDAGGLSVTDATLNGDISRDGNGSYTATLSNTSIDNMTINLAPGLLHSDYYLVASGEGAAITLQAGETKSFTNEFTLTFYDGFEYNTAYSLILYNTGTMQVEYYIGEVQISDSNMPDIPELECLSFEIGGDPENIYPDNISFMAQVVSSTDARELFQVAIWNPDTWKLIQNTVTPEYEFIAGEPLNIEFNVAFQDAKPGTLYASSLHNDQGEPISPPVYFRVSEMAGVSQSAIDTASPAIKYDRTTHTLSISSESKLTNVTLASVSGQQISPLAKPLDKGIVIDLSSYSGMIIVSATDSNGNTKTSKIVL